MHRRQKLIRISKLLRYGEPLLDFVFLAGISWFFIQHLPLEVLSRFPATGGDTGSHYWPLKVLVEYGISNGALKIWNPGNLGGEPLFVHYFPLPFMLMAAGSFIMPTATAFNIGTILPLLLLPLAVYLGCRLMGLRFPAPIFATALCLPFIYNESFSMWGGNTLSTLAGQFAHVYALCFIVLGLGAMFYENRKNSFPFVSGLMFAAVALSHAYVLLGVPFCVLGYVLFAPRRNFSYRLIHSLKSALIALAFSVWFLIPMLDNSEWNTAFFFVWQSENIWAEVAPKVFYPTLVILGLCCLGLVVAFFIRKKAVLRFSWLFLVWLIPIAAYTGMYWIFPKVGLVDVRVVPQVQLFISLLAGSCLGMLLRSFSRLLAWVLAGPLLLAAVYWSGQQVQNFEHWAKWNYSGWRVKEAYAPLSQLYDHIRGDFSDPRIVFEHNDINNTAGTLRVFEMLPYFATRATLESVYLQASVLSAMAFNMQSLVSKTPSCPFSQYKCSSYVKNAEDVQRLSEKMSLLGVEGLILHTDEVRGPVAETDLFLEERSFGNWHYRELRKPVSLVEVIEHLPTIERSLDWKEAFYNWFLNYRRGSAHLISASQMSAESEKLFSNSKESWRNNKPCNPQLKVDFNSLSLSTDCPNKAHMLKFAYHPSWKGDISGEIYNLSPGYLAFIPGKEQVNLRFGQSPLWLTSWYISLVGMLLVCFWGLSSYYRSRTSL